METMKKRRGTVFLLSAKNKTSSIILNFLQSVKLVLRETGEERVAIVQPGQDKRTNKSVSGFLGEILTDAADSTKVVISQFTNVGDLFFKREMTVKKDAKIANK